MIRMIKNFRRARSARDFTFEFRFGAEIVPNHDSAIWNESYRLIRISASIQTLLYILHKHEAKRCAVCILYNPNAE